MGAHPAQGPLPMRLEYVLDRYLAVCGLVDQSVVSLHQCACSLRGARDGAQRMAPSGARSPPNARSGAHRPTLRRRTRAPPRTRRRARRQAPAAPRPVRAPPSVPATPSPVHTYTLPCASWPSHGCGPDDRAPRSHLRAPSSPPANSPRCARARQRTSPAARADSRNGARSPCPLPAPPDPGRAKPSCGKQHPGADQKPAQSYHPVQLVAAPRVVPANPGIARLQAPRGGRKADATAASRARSPPDSAVDGRPTAPRHAGARVPSACSRSSAARRSRPAPTADPRARPPRPAPRAPASPVAPAPAACAAPRHGAAAVAAQLGPLLPARPTPGGNSRAATARGHRGNRTLHRPDRQPARRSRDAARGSAVQHLAQAGKIGPQGAPYLILNLHADYGSEAASQSPAGISYGAGVGLVAATDRSEAREQGVAGSLGGRAPPATKAPVRTVSGGATVGA